MLELKDYSVNPILEGINIEFDVGRTYIVMGANGVGKSTFCLLYTSPSPRDRG